MEVVTSNAKQATTLYVLYKININILKFKFFMHMNSWEADSGYSKVHKLLRQSTLLETYIGLLGK